jgi:hypothetical protein
MNKFKVFFLTQLIITSPSLLAWDLSFKGDLSRKSTDNVNATNTQLKSDTIKIFSAYLQSRDENDRFRLKFKANRYTSVRENNSNTVEASYQRKFSSDLSDNFQFKLFKEKYLMTPTLSGDTSSDNQGLEFQVYFAKPMEKSLTLSGTYIFNYKDYTNSLNRKDYNFEAVFGVEKIIKNIITFSPDVALTYNNSKESYYSTFSIAGNLYVSIELHENFELYSSYNYNKTNYLDRTFIVISRGRSTNEKEEVTSNTLETGFNFYATEWLTLDGKCSLIKYVSNNSTNSYEAREWAVGLSLKF